MIMGVFYSWKKCTRFLMKQAKGFFNRFLRNNWFSSWGCTDSKEWIALGHKHHQIKNPTNLFKCEKMTDIVHKCISFRIQINVMEIKLASWKQMISCPYNYCTIQWRRGKHCIWNWKQIFQQCLSGLLRPQSPGQTMRHGTQTLLVKHWNFV